MLGAIPPAIQGRKQRIERSHSSSFFECCLVRGPDLLSQLMTITISDEELHGVKLTHEEAMRDLAIGLFADRKATLGQGARIANVSQEIFLAILAERKVPLHYDVEDFEADLKTLRKLGQL